jgi:hypothetical protein
MKRYLRMKSALGNALAAFCLVCAQQAPAEVRSCTLGIDTNCPSGLSE